MVWSMADTAAGKDCHFSTILWRTDALLINFESWNWEFLIFCSAYRQTCSTHRRDTDVLGEKGTKGVKNAKDLTDNFQFGNFFIFFNYLSNINFDDMESKNLNRLKVLLAEKNLSNKWLSEKMGVGQPTISKWVTNSAQPNLEMLIKLSKILNVDINDLIRPDEVIINENVIPAVD